MSEMRFITLLVIRFDWSESEGAFHNFLAQTFWLIWVTAGSTCQTVSFINLFLIHFDWSELSLGAHVRRCLLSSCCSYIWTDLSFRWEHMSEGAFYQVVAHTFGLIWAFVGSTCQKVPFITLLLIHFNWSWFSLGVYVRRCLLSLCYSNSLTDLGFPWEHMSEGAFYHFVAQTFWLIWVFVGSTYQKVLSLFSSYILTDLSLCWEHMWGGDFHSFWLIQFDFVVRRYFQKINTVIPRIDDNHRTQPSQSSDMVFITKTCLYKFDPFKLYFYTVKLEFTGV